MDDDYCPDDLAPETRQAITAECAQFQVEQAQTLAKAYKRPGYGVENAGHDFWLTRNGHGAGFWDRRLGDIGDALTMAANACGERYLYVGDNGKIYQG